MHDIVIIGAGPAGLATAIEAKRAGLDYLLIDKGAIVNSIHGFPKGMLFFSTPELLEIGGVPFTSASMRPSRAEGLEYYARVAEYFGLSLRLFEAVETIRGATGEFNVATDAGTYQTRTIVLATGYFDQPNLLGVPGESLPNVSHYYDEPFAFFRRKVAVVGGKNSAAIAALELYRHGAEVTLIHRREKLSEGIKYWILPDIENRIKEGSVAAYFSATVTSIREKSLVLRDATGKELILPNDFTFVLIGYHPDESLMRTAGLVLDPESLAPVHDPKTMETTVKGIFVAGSIAAGRNNNKIFIENGRLHGKLIIDTVVGR
ncbi:MAG TPA: YpdA family putative bacillithiol disulfide reductase [Bacteroidota bacterium]|nr:YpdA family putative bacillithiol disulfide reductase [Bacteroidota bacterium]